MPALGLSKAKFELGDSNNHNFKVFGEDLASVAAVSLTSKGYDWNLTDWEAKANFIQIKKSTVKKKPGPRPMDTAGDLTVTVTAGSQTAISTYGVTYVP